MSSGLLFTSLLRIPMAFVEGFLYRIYIFLRVNLLIPTYYYTSKYYCKRTNRPYH